MVEKPFLQLMQNLFITLVIIGCYSRGKKWQLHGKAYSSEKIQMS